MSDSKSKSSKQDFYRKIFEQYYSYVYAIVFNNLRSIASHEDIEDCVGDIFSDIYIHYTKDEKYDDIKGFVITISERRAIDTFRRLTVKRKHIIASAEEELLKADDISSVEERAENSEIRQMLLKYILELGEPDSLIIMQKYYYNRNSKEISEMISMKPSAVRKRCSRALKKLKELLSDAGFFG